MWVRHSSVSGQQNYITWDNDALKWYLSPSTGKMGLYSGQAICNGNTVLRVDTWYHLALVKSSGTTSMYLNGVLDGSGTDSVNYTEGNVSLGDDPNDNSNPDFAGWMNGVRIYKGVAKYTANFIAPNRNDFIPVNMSASAPEIEEPAGPIWNTNANGSTKSSPAAYNGTGKDGASSLVLAIPCNSGDTSNSNYLDHALAIAGTGSTREVPTTGISNTTSSPKWYGSCLSWDGDGDYMKISDRDTDWQFGTGDFTIEAWADLSERSSEDYQALFSTAGSGSGWVFGKDNSSNWGWLYNSGNFSSNWSMTMAQSNVYDSGWHHLAICRSGSTIRMFVDGEIKSSATDNNNYNYGDDLIMGNRWNTSSSYTHGDGSKTCDYRIYKGYAKYTAAFTPAVGPSARPEGIDTSVDTPTNGGTDEGAGGEVTGNYCVLNAADNGGALIKQGGLQISHNAGSWKGVRGTFGLTSGKWYFEVTLRGMASDSNNGWYAGVGTKDASLTGVLGSSQYHRQGNIRWSHDTNTSFYSTGAVNDVYGVAIDMDNKKMWISDNNTWQGSGNPATGANAHFTIESDHDEVFPLFHIYGSIITLELNFGATAYKYTAPSGFKALCTQNLSDTFSGEDDDIVNNPSKFFDTVIFDGDGSNGREIKRFNFGPDLVWGKQRDDTSSHLIFDVIRGATKRIVSNSTQAEDTQANQVTAFNSDGFTHNNDLPNQSGQKAVFWGWDAGTAAITPSSSYDITPSAQWANTTAGFSITKYTGNGSDNQTIPHALGAVPGFVMVKNLDSSVNWNVKHKNNSSDKIFYLDNNQPEDTASGSQHGHIGDLTSNVTINLTTNATNFANTNADGTDYIMYAWAEVPGFSKFGMYGGQAFVYLGFRPATIIIKDRGDTSYWQMYSNKTNATNPSSIAVAPSEASAESSWEGGTAIDWLSNGFKIRSSGGSIADTNMVYMAWAEHPFKISRAR